jgi:hypothetical protein
MKKNPTRPTPAQAPPARPDFDVLLSTWPLLIERPGSPPVAAETLNALPPEERERQYGDGHYAERRQLLRIVLELLGRPSTARRAPDLDAVFAALAAARTAARRDALTRTKRRWTQDHARKRDQLVANLRSAWDEYRAWRAGWDHEALWPPEHVVRRGDALLADLEAVAPDLRADQWQVPKRRPPSPWNDEARKKLEKAGVPKGIPGFQTMRATKRCPLTPRNIHDALLMAAGLLPVKSDRSPED